jgi:streptogramin lyase
VRTLLAIAVAVSSGAAAAWAAQPTARVATGAGPCGAAVGYGSVWVAVYGTGYVVRIDPGRNRITKRIRVAKGVCPIVVGAGAVWVASDRTNALYRIDPKRSRVTRRIPVAEWPAHITVAFGSVWVSGYETGEILRIDARTARLRRVYRTGGNPSGLAAVGRRLWFSFGRGTSLGKLDVTTGEFDEFALGHRAPGYLEHIGGELWTTTGDGYALRVSPTSGTVVASFRIPGTPAQPAVAPNGLIWVAEKERNTVTRLDPATDAIVDVSPAGRGALAIAVARGDVWVTSYAGSDVWRFRGSP